ncbi:hypothetical protein [Microbacterium sp. PAMC22086]|uniref:hypothetical protein n=1 Tax=Microbacterium sp. PAMC22086 TaxID=2861281 RepID=UPI0035C1B648
MLGSTSANVLHHATRPTLVIPSDDVAAARRTSRRATPPRRCAPTGSAPDLSRLRGDRSGPPLRGGEPGRLKEYPTRVYGCD